MRKTAIVSVSCLLFAGGVSAAQGAPAVRVETHIQAQSLVTALEEFSRERQLQLVYATDEVATLSSAGATGNLSAAEALQKILAGTGLSFRFLDDNTVTVEKAAAAPSEPAPKTTSPADPAGVDTATLRGIPEILVTGKATTFNIDVLRSIDDAQPYYILRDTAIRQSGATSVEDFLRQNLTMNTTPAAARQTPANFLGNVSALNLRGLGSNQTLILINGRRTAGVAYANAVYQPDTNGIPLAMIDRIEVLPSSASAIYGGAAVGGVVNVVLKKDYTGGNVTLSFDDTFDGSAPIRTAHFAYGTALEEGRTHVMVGGSYSDSDVLYNKDRPELMQRGLNTVRRNNPALIASPMQPFAVGTTPNIGSADGSNLVLRDGTPLGASTTFVPAGINASTPLAQLNAGLLANAGTYNYSLANTADGSTGLLRPIGSSPEVKSLFASVRRDMTDGLAVFAEFFSTDNLSESTTVGSGLFRIAAGAPTNPFQQDVVVQIPDAAIMPYSTQIKTRRIVAGFLADLPFDWKLSGDYTWNTSKYYQQFTTYAPDLNGLMQDGTLNPFTDTLATLDLRPYYGTIHNYNPGKLSDIGLRVAGAVGRLPAGSPTLTIGLERREEERERSPGSAIYPSSPANSNSYYYLPQSQRTDSFYAEANVPLIGSANEFPFARLLDLQLAVRTERYSVDSGTLFQYDSGPLMGSNPPLSRYDVDYTSTNQTIGVRFKPVDSVLLRASYATAFLPPAFSQLLPGTFNPTSATNVIDPRRGNQVTTVSFLNGGNGDLDPQTSESWDVGLIYEPSFVPGLRLNLEWYRIEQDDVILSPSAQQIVNNESLFAGRVTRGPVAGDPFGVGAITFVDFSLVNAAEASTDGFDLSIAYRRETERYGDFSFSLLGTYVAHYAVQSAPGGPQPDTANQVANGGPLRWRGTAALNWQRDRWSIGWNAAYYGSYPQYQAGGITSYVLAQGDDRVDDQIYHNLVGSYRFPEADGGWSLLSGFAVQAGIKNLFDATPPLDVYYGTFRGYYASPFGDPRLRSYWVSLSKDF